MVVGGGELDERCRDGRVKGSKNCFVDSALEAARRRLGGKGSRTKLLGKSCSGTLAPDSSNSGNQDKRHDHKDRCYRGGIPKQDSRNSYFCSSSRAYSRMACQFSVQIIHDPEYLCYAHTHCAVWRLPYARFLPCAKVGTDLTSAASGFSTDTEEDSKTPAPSPS